MSLPWSRMGNIHGFVLNWQSYWSRSPTAQTLNSVRHFWYESSNVQPHYYRLRYVEPCHWLGEVARCSSWAIKLSALCLNKNNCLNCEISSLSTWPPDWATGFEPWTFSGQADKSLWIRKHRSKQVSKFGWINLRKRHHSPWSLWHWVDGPALLPPGWRGNLSSEILPPTPQPELEKKAPLGYDQWVGTFRRPLIGSECVICLQSRFRFAKCNWWLKVNGVEC